MILPVCQPFPVLTHSRPRLARRPVTIRSKFVPTLNHFDPHRHYILELVQAGVDPRPPLPLEQGLRDLLVRVRLRHWRISVLSTTMLGCRGAVAAHNVLTALRAPRCFCCPGLSLLAWRETPVPCAAPARLVLPSSSGGTGGTGAPAAHQGRT